MVKARNLSFKIVPFLHVLEVLIIYVSWFVYVGLHNLWSELFALWPISLTMVFASFVASSTAQGGAFIAFPVFTFLLNISPEHASTFSLMIQAIGMGAASLFIYLEKIKVENRVILLSLIPASLGFVIGHFYIPVPSLYAKILFTSLVLSFGLVLYLVTWVLKLSVSDQIKNWSVSKYVLTTLFALVGGMITSKIGFGVNVFAFAMMSIAFGINSRVATPTAVVLMAILSIFGFGVHAVIGIEEIVWNYWLAAIPVVVIGAPLGSYFASKVTRYTINKFVITLILLELMSTFIFVDLSKQSLLAMGIMTIVFLISFLFLILYRHRSP